LPCKFIEILWSPREFLDDVTLDDVVQQPFRDLLFWRLPNNIAPGKGCRACGASPKMGRATHGGGSLIPWGVHRCVANWNSPRGHHDRLPLGGLH
jgi:hypothetical protein